MSAVPAALLRLAVWLSPPHRRAVRQEQWTADTQLAETVGLSPTAVAFGAFSTSLTSWRPTFKMIPVVASCVAVLGVVFLGVSAFGMGDYRETNMYVSEGDQAAAENLVAEFVASNPVPTSYDKVSGATIEEQLVGYWQRVPWRAVAEQWDCKFLDETEVRISIAGDGRRVAVVENGYQCADASGLAVEGASTVASKTEYLAMRASTAG